MTFNPFRRSDKDGDTTQGYTSGDTAHTTQPARSDSRSTDSSKTSEASQETGKGKPTPKRKTAEERNLRPLVPKDRKANAKEERARQKAREDAQYQAMRTGDLAHMPKAERLPWRVYIRDYVDARYNLGEFFIPFSVATLICLFIVTAAFQQYGAILLIVMYVYLIAVVIDVFIMWRGLKKKLVEKYGEQVVSRGSRSASYAWTRAIQMRRWRLPKPRYPKRGNWPQ